MITSKAGQTADTNPNWVHGCFMVRVASDFLTYQQILAYAEQDQLTSASTGSDTATTQILSEIGTGDGKALPLYYSKRKCRDTSLGGNDAINPLPQFGIDDDISHPFLESNYDFGAPVQMGQVYSENYDDTQQILYMGFGIPVFSNLSSFWKNAVNDDVARYMNQGVGLKAEHIGKLIGEVPVKAIKIATIPFKYIAAMSRSLQTVKISKYYSFSSQMPMYFRFVNTILVHLATNMSMMGSSDAVTSTGSVTSNTTAVDQLTFDRTPKDDVSGMATIFSQFGLDMAQIMTKRYLYENGQNDSIKNRFTDEAMYKTGTDDSNSTAPEITSNQSTNTGQDGSTSSGATTDDGKERFWTMGWFDGFAAAYGDAIYDGHLFIGFRIDKSMGTEESFSNATGESSVAQMANSKFAEARDIQTSTMGGRYDEGMIGKVVSGVLGAAKGILSGVSSAFSMDSVTATATGAAKIDIPDVWMSSSYSRSASFTISCLSPYGDLQSIFTSEYVPLACMLAGTLPRGTGENSYSAPFICQAYCRGVFSSPLCIIDSLSVSRGADQFGFTASRLPLRLQMHVTLKDLSPAMYMSMGGDRGYAAQIFGTDSNFGEYMLTLAGMGLQDRLTPFKAIRRKTEILMSTLYKNKLSPFQVGMETGNRFLISRMISTVVSGGRGLQNN